MAILKKKKSYLKCETPKKPKPPLERLVYEGIGLHCPLCESSLAKKWFKIMGCVHPECSNYYKKSEK